MREVGAAHAGLHGAGEVLTRDTHPWNVVAPTGLERHVAQGQPKRARGVFATGVEHLFRHLDGRPPMGGRTRRCLLLCGLLLSHRSPRRRPREPTRAAIR